ncbi:MAG: hypothetical protein ACYDDB_07050 [bacterium]
MPLHKHNIPSMEIASDTSYPSGAWPDTMRPMDTTLTIFTGIKAVGFY